METLGELVSRITGWVWAYMDRRVYGRFRSEQFYKMTL
jgi:uncharacterized Fe-S cluster-containing radical SAM superfamily protein